MVVFFATIYQGIFSESEFQKGKINTIKKKVSRKEQKRYRVGVAKRVLYISYVRRKSIARFIALARAVSRNIPYRRVINKKIRSSISSCDTDARVIKDHASRPCF
uniref:Uncharacterized protein n=1 Tax=Trichogramma kaykai TaxID=54128 RepID=A0ABD2XH84_9HYME